MDWGGLWQQASGKSTGWQTPQDTEFLSADGHCDLVETGLPCCPLLARPSGVPGDPLDHWAGLRSPYIL